LHRRSLQVYSYVLTLKHLIGSPFYPEIQFTPSHMG
jgi:hypothetical protein